MKAGRLTFVDWMKSYKGVEEVAFFSLRDWKPWLMRYRDTFWSGAMNRGRRLFRIGPRSELN